MARIDGNAGGRGRIGLALVLLGAGCGSSAPDKCAGVVQCASAGSLSCSDDAGAVMVCRVNSHGCLEWGEQARCEARKACEGQDAACICQDECTLGDSRCNGSVVESCAADNLGCLTFVSDGDCSDDGESCIETGSTAGCSSGCTSPCAPLSATRCNGGAVETCSASDDCLLWTVTDTCGTSQRCDAGHGTAVCSCINECAAGASQCDGTVLDSCLSDSDGCRTWQAGADCAETGQVCLVMGGSAACATCTSHCTLLGDSRCLGGVVETCTQLGDCLDWQPTDTCGVREACTVAGGVAACTCDDQCDLALDTECVGDILTMCLVDPEGCLYLAPGTNCSTSGGLCHDLFEPAVCGPACTSDCSTEGAYRCNGGAVEICSAAGGCLLWQVLEVCGAHQSCAVSLDRARCECNDILVDGDFELLAGDWSEQSSTFGFVLCTPATCGGAAIAFSGDAYAWFGGVGDAADLPELAHISQRLVVPAGEPVTLFFMLAAEPGPDAKATDLLSVVIDGKTLASFSATDPTLAYAHNLYRLVVLDLSKFADGARHSIAFEVTLGSVISAFYLDRVSLRLGANCCVDTCDIPDLTRCVSEGVVTCAPRGACLQWTVTDACEGAEVCDNSRNPAVCRP